MNNKKNEDIFINDLVNVFPQLKEEILDEDYSGLITLQIGCFKRFTQNAIDSNDMITVKRCFQFVDENIDDVIFKIENSIFLSYLEHLNFEKNPKAKLLLSKKLKQALVELEKNTSTNSKNDKLNKFLSENKGFI